MILGLLAEIYPEHMTQYANKLMDIYLRALKAEVSQCIIYVDFSVIVLYV